MDPNHQVKFATLLPNGTLTNVRLIKQADMMKCPFFIMFAGHYREDGTCRCDDPAYRKSVMRKWGYTAKDFKRKGL
jgi:hypothetical protein